MARTCGLGLNRFVHEGMNHILNVKVHFKDSQWKCKYIDLYERCVKIMKNINDKKNFISTGYGLLFLFCSCYDWNYLIWQSLVYSLALFSHILTSYC